MDDEPARKPTLTRISVPASESRKFCACAGPCDDLLNAGKGFGQQREEVPTATHDILFGVADGDLLFGKDIGGKIQIHGCFP
jgi:hypothetical protein